VAPSAVLIIVLLALVEHDPWRLWPLQGVAVGLLAAATGWSLDEPSAAVVDAAPRGLRWRTAARWPAIAVLLAAWSAGVWWARESAFGHPWQVGSQGVAAAAAAIAWVTARRASGLANPGQRWAMVIVPLAAAWALARPAARWIPVFPYGVGSEGASWTASAALWATTGAVSIVVVAVLLRRDGMTL